MNPKLFGAIVVVGASLAACRSGIQSGKTVDQAVAHDLSVAGNDAAQPVDLAQPLTDLAGSDLPQCCSFGGAEDLSGCMPIPCILI